MGVAVTPRRRRGGIVLFCVSRMVLGVVTKWIVDWPGIISESTGQRTDLFRFEVLQGCRKFSRNVSLADTKMSLRFLWETPGGARVLVEKVGAFGVHAWQSLVPDPVEYRPPCGLDPSGSAEGVVGRAKDVPCAGSFALTPRCDREKEIASGLCRSRCALMPVASVRCLVSQRNEP